MASPRFGDQHELSGSVQKHGHVKGKSVANATVTKKTTMPPVPPNVAMSVEKSNQRSRIHERIARKYHGVGGAKWGQTVHGSEGC